MERDNNGIIFSAVIPLILDDSEKKKKKKEARIIQKNQAKERIFKVERIGVSV